MKALFIIDDPPYVKVFVCRSPEFAAPSDAAGIRKPSQARQEETLASIAAHLQRWSPCQIREDRGANSQCILNSPFAIMR
jgi:hypothetical protein